MNPLLLTETEAAERLHISPRLLRDLRAKGHIRYVALSTRRIAYRPEDCDAFVESRVRKAEPCPSPKSAKPSMPRQRARSGNIVPFSEQFAGRRG